MPDFPALVLFVACAALIAVAQGAILASTVRGRRALRGGAHQASAQGARADAPAPGVTVAPDKPLVEWAYALGPVPVILALLWWTWLALPR